MVLCWVILKICMYNSPIGCLGAGLCSTHSASKKKTSPNVVKISNFFIITRLKFHKHNFKQHFNKFNSSSICIRTPFMLLSILCWVFNVQINILWKYKFSNNIYDLWCFSFYAHLKLHFVIDCESLQQCSLRTLNKVSAMVRIIHRVGISIQKHAV